MLLGEMQGPCPWGLLLVKDSESKEEIPTWASDEEQVAFAATALVVRVLHQDEGDVLVRAWDDNNDVRGGLTFSGEIDLPSSLLQVSDALGEQFVEIAVPTVRQHIEVYTNAVREASEVHLVLSDTNTA